MACWACKAAAWHLAAWQGAVLQHHLTSCNAVAQVPWDDLRYIFGEIMYGGHIVEDWDRRLCSAYLAKYFQEPLLEGFEMFPGFFTPPNTSSHKQVGICPADRARLRNAHSEAWLVDLICCWVCLDSRRLISLLVVRAA